MKLHDLSRFIINSLFTAAKSIIFKLWWKRRSFVANCYVRSLWVRAKTSEKKDSKGVCVRIRDVYFVVVHV